MPCATNVDVVLTPDTTKDPVKWTMENCITKAKGGYGGYPVVVIPKDNGPTDHHLVYLIDNPSGSTWKFAKDSAALWVTNGTADPTKPSTDSHIPVGSIKTVNPNPSDPATADTKLTFTDHNGNAPVKLHYTLNFVDGSKSSSTLDPIIDNGGCCTLAAPAEFQASYAEFIVYLVLAFIAGLVVMRAIRR